MFHQDSLACTQIPSFSGIMVLLYDHLFIFSKDPNMLCFDLNTQTHLLFLDKALKMRQATDRAREIHPRTTAMTYTAGCVFLSSWSEGGTCDSKLPGRESDKLHSRKTSCCSPAISMLLWKRKGRWVSLFVEKKKQLIVTVRSRNRCLSL